MVSEGGAGVGVYRDWSQRKQNYHITIRIIRTIMELLVARIAFFTFRESKWSTECESRLWVKECACKVRMGIITKIVRLSQNRSVCIETYYQLPLHMAWKSDSKSIIANALHQYWNESLLSILCYTSYTCYTCYTSLKVCNFIKKRLQYRCFPVNAFKNIFFYRELLVAAFV